MTTRRSWRATSWSANIRRRRAVLVDQAARQPDVGRRQAAHTHQARGRHDGVLRLHPQRGRHMGRQGRRDHRRERWRGRGALRRAPTPCAASRSSIRSSSTGQAVDGFDDLQGRYSIPRPQNAEPCVSHNGTVLPTKDGRYLYAQAFYQGGNSFYDFTDPAAPQELAYADLEDDLGKANSWSTYFYNGTVFVNGGLNRRSTTPQPRVQNVITGPKGSARISSRRWAWSNPPDAGGVSGSVGRDGRRAGEAPARLTLLPRRAARRRTAGPRDSPGRSRRRALQHRVVSSSPTNSATCACRARAPCRRSPR